jgi:hypothetical protein
MPWDPGAMEVVLTGIAGNGLRHVRLIDKQAAQFPSAAHPVCA